jgi:hypothetical protein
VGGHGTLQKALLSDVPLWRVVYHFTKPAVFIVVVDNLLVLE